MKKIDPEELRKKIRHHAQQALCSAAELDDGALLSAALALGADPNQAGPGLPLALAGAQTAPLLIEAGAKTEARLTGGMTVWLKALDQGDWAKAVALAPHCVKSVRDDKGRDGLALLIRAAEVDGAGSAPGFDQALAIALENSKPDARAFDGTTPLMASAQSASGTALPALIGRGGFDARDAEGRTALSRAARSKRGLAVEALLAAGADPSLADKEGMTALMWAARVGAPDLVARLGALGFVQARCRAGWTALEHAVVGGGRAAQAAWDLLEKEPAAVAEQSARQALALAQQNGKRDWAEKLSDQWLPRARARMEAEELGKAAGESGPRSRPRGI